MKDIQASFEFDTVIVDEAARHNPLDLLIPLTLARRRIILVENHRQLPQMLDEEVVDSLESSDPDAEVKRVLEKSMFEQLFQHLREFESTDGIRRIVTLDQQFRTHPVLGEFVSAQFYDRHGDAFRNGRPETRLAEFAHGLAAYEGRPAAWVDVPANSGARLGQDEARRGIEAKVIVGELVAALEADEHLTFGVIAFYSGQVRAVWEELEADRLCRSRAIFFTLGALVKRCGRCAPRQVRVGDEVGRAFQGREFDVVYLSTTRSQPLGARHAPRFGFLALPNRLCVAISGQHSCLLRSNQQFGDVHPQCRKGTTPGAGRVPRVNRGCQSPRRPA